MKVALAFWQPSEAAVLRHLETGELIAWSALDPAGYPAARRLLALAACDPYHVRWMPRLVDRALNALRTAPREKEDR